MIKVFYDGCMFYRQKEGGVNVVFNELLKRITQNSHFKCYCSFPSNNALGIVGLKRIIIPKIRPNRLFVHFWRLINEYYIQRFNPDIFHSTYYSTPILKRRTKIVLTIYDMIYEIFQEDFNTLEDRKFISLKRKLAHDADAIICISESTQNDVFEYYKDIDKTKVSVIPLAVDGFFKELVSKEEKNLFKNMNSLTKPYILYVGRTRGGYKNFNLLFEVYVSTKEICENLDLVIVTSDIVDMVNAENVSLRKSKIKVFNNVRAIDLRLFYSCASMLVYPSKYEGFGLPILEAMACGTPVVASDVSSLPEVGGDAALYFNAVSSDDLRKKVLTLQKDNNYKNILIKRGYQNVKRFSWELSAEKLGNVYKSLY